MGTFAERLVEKLEPWNTGPVVAGKTDLERWCNAVGAMFQPLLDLAEEEGSDGEPGYTPPFGRLFDPQTVPRDGMRYLAQYVGVTLPEGGTTEEWRAILKAESGLERGTRGSLEALLRKTLGAVPFIILEREPTAYSLVVVIPVGHVTAAVYEEINLTIPAGIFYQIVEVENSWYAATRKWSEVVAGKSWETIKEGEY